MRNFKVIVIALSLALAVGCKKKKDADTGTNTASGSSDMAGSNMAGSGSDMAATPDAAVAVEPPKAIVNTMAADLKWVPLDEKAGDKGPMVSWLYGDAMKEPNGFFLKVGAANKGMWHTHSAGYHGVVVSGAPNHLQDGETKAKPLPAGSYWFEPGGAAHNSQCLGKEPCVVFVHFTEGKFDFAPAEMKKDGKPDPTYVEKREKDLKWSALVPEAGDKGPMVAVVWGDPASGPSGAFIKSPAGMVSPAHSHSADYHGVVIKGTLMNYAADDKAPKEMGPGSYWMQPGGGNHIT
ncbi:MAG: DUF4437 domain-containing protein, partial [Myxococcota bacterium]|nr:DUF4437 domain-containing protein [Myxococcota bacterium]